MKAVIVLITAVLIAAWGCGKISSSVEAQNPPQFSGTFAFGNGPLVGATTATNGSLTGNMVFAGSCLAQIDRKSTRLNSSHGYISYAVFCLKKKKLTPYTSSA